MSSPFPSELMAAVHGSRVAWVFDAKGVRNVWVADGPDFIHTARQLTHYSADDGQPIASLRLTPDGKTAVYALGSELNDAQESANPESWTKGAKQQVFALDVDGKDAAPRLLGDMGCPDEDCEDIEISPDGTWAVWSAKKKLWLASVDGKQQAKELATVRGAAGEPKWSPDGKHIAFVSSRDGHSLVAIYDFDGGLASATWRRAWTRIPCRAGLLTASGLSSCAPPGMREAAADSGARAAVVAVDCRCCQWRGSNVVAQRREDRGFSASPHRRWLAQRCRRRTRGFCLGAGWAQSLVFDRCLRRGGHTAHTRRF